MWNKLIDGSNDERETDFLPAILEVTETPPSPVGRLVMWTILALLTVAIIWSFVGTINEVAVATGKVTGLGNDAIHGIYQITRYDDYEVTYAHLSNVFANYGKEVKAGQVIAVSADSLHVEVKYKGEELNPLEFLTMIYSNLKVMEQNGKPGAAPPQRFRWACACCQRSARIDPGCRRRHP